MTNSKSISFIRHGKTEANEKRLYCGHTDLDLSLSGITELRELRKTVRYPAGDIYVTTGFKRTVSTLRVLYGETESITIPELAEYNFGDFEMKNHEELQYLQCYINWIEDEHARCPNGESRAGFNARITEGFEKLKAISGSVVCICHGGVVASLMEAIFPGKKGFYDWQPGFGRGYTVTFGVNIDYKNI